MQFLFVSRFRTDLHEPCCYSFEVFSLFLLYYDSVPHSDGEIRTPTSLALRIMLFRQSHHQRLIDSALQYKSTQSNFMFAFIVTIYNFVSYTIYPTPIFATRRTSDISAAPLVSTKYKLDNFLCNKCTEHQDLVSLVFRNGGAKYMAL
jgi:hypothetical protein